ncbi:hypothetical protein F4780DRAFT_8705 [Xylariomycetidae sp. FL0641]|nr:hypothetical protein F4780DRAFT_8705 [Xylariomycetidae sp. FL0641]
MDPQAAAMAQDLPNEMLQVRVLFILGGILTFISTVLIAARCTVRFWFIRDPGMDDYMIIAALFSVIAFLVANAPAKIAGLGMPMQTLTLDNMTEILQLTFAVELIYYTCIWCIKTSIVFMYQRIAIALPFKRLCIGTNVVLLVFYVVCIVTTITQCLPVEKAWDITGLVEGTCIDTTAFFYFTSGFNIITDIWIIALPIRTLKKLQVPKADRHSLYIVFGAAGFATIMSVVRLYSIYAYTFSPDPFRDGALINIWSVLEINVGIMCASVPALKPLLAPDRLREARNRKGYGYHSSERSGAQSKNGSETTASQSQIVRMDSGKGSSSPTGQDFDYEMEYPGRSRV